ncbi:MAG: dihydrodipicolinate reductase [Theionarchaea archaeon]|nr:dihydrodipicolinate reductase [Theionarchaea archaeon]
MDQKIGLFGLGSIGRSIAQFLLDSNHDVVLAVDRDPEKVGADLGSVVGIEELGLEVSEYMDPRIASDCDLVVHSTCSRFRDAFPQLSDIVGAGCNAISTCEELSYPYLRNPGLSEQLDMLARDRGVTVLGTGVNPGFLLDALPAFVAKACTRVDSFYVSRVVEASFRREPLQRKIGLGMNPEDFASKASQGSMGHIGLFESCALISTAMGWKLEEIKQEISPIIAGDDIHTDYFEIKGGQVRGLKQELEGMAGGTMIRMYLEMSVGTENPGDSVRIEGDPPVDLFIKNGLHGDRATVGRVVSHIGDVLVANPGLVTVLDLPTNPHGARTELVRDTSLTGSGRLL